MMGDGGRMMTDGKRSGVLTATEEVKESPAPTSSLSTGDSDTACTVRRGSMFSWHLHYAMRLSLSARHGCYQPELCIAPLVPPPLLVLVLLKPPGPPRLPLPPLEHGPLPSDAGLTCPIVFFRPPYPTLKGALRPPWGEQHVPANSFWHGVLWPKPQLVYVPLDVPGCRYPYGPPLHERVGGGRDRHAGPAVDCGMSGSIATHVSLPFFFRQLHFSYRCAKYRPNPQNSRVVLLTYSYCHFDPTDLYFYRVYVFI